MGKRRAAAVRMRGSVHCGTRSATARLKGMFGDSGGGIKMDLGAAPWRQSSGGTGGDGGGSRADCGWSGSRMCGSGWRLLTQSGPRAPAGRWSSWAIDLRRRCPKTGVGQGGAAAQGCLLHGDGQERNRRLPRTESGKSPQRVLHAGHEERQADPRLLDHILQRVDLIGLQTVRQQQRSPRGTRPPGRARRWC